MEIRYTAMISTVQTFIIITSVDFHVSFSLFIGIFSSILFMFYTKIQCRPLWCTLWSSDSVYGICCLESNTIHHPSDCLMIEIVGLYIPFVILTQSMLKKQKVSSVVTFMVIITSMMNLEFFSYLHFRTQIYLVLCPLCSILSFA